MVFQGLEVAVGLIGLAMLPTSKVDAHELVGQGPAGLVVFALVALLLLLIIALGPGFFLEGAAGVFVERLPTKLGTAIADVNGLGGAALDDYRRDTVEFGHVSGFLEPIPVGAEGDEQ